MSDPLRSIVAALADLVEAARGALADMDAAEVPASLRRVAAHRGGRLPPPLAASLLDVLAADEWLRERVREYVADHDLALGPTSEAMLGEHPGWWRKVAAAAVDTAGAELRAKLERARTLAAEQKRRAAEEKQARRALQEEIALARRGGHEPTGDREALAAARREIEALTRQVDEARATAVAAADAERRAREELDAAQQKLREARRQRAEALRELERGGRGLAPRDPVELAKTLDALEAAAMPTAPSPPADDAESVAAAGGAHRWRPPPGVAPDRREAIDALLSLETPYTLVVDGHNVMFTLDEERWATPEARRRLEQGLVRLRRAARSPVRVVVVYDSGLEGGRLPDIPGGKLEVRYAPADLAADDVVVDVAANATPPVIVVTTDRELRERVERVGASALWSEALADWLG